MTVAIPVWQNRVSPVFDTASCLLVVRRHRGREVERKEFLLGAQPSHARAPSLKSLRVGVLLCAAISEPLQRALERRDIRVESHLCGEVDALLDAFVAGDFRRPEFRMPGCWESYHRGKSTVRATPKHHRRAPGPTARAS